MRLLLDTHAFLWWCTDDPQLTTAARAAIADGDSVHVSTVSAWEVAINVARKRITLADPFANMVRRKGFAELAVTFAHAERLGELPLHHRDPFDRMLAAQAQVEGLTLVTHNPAFKPYSIQVIWS